MKKSAVLLIVLGFIIILITIASFILNIYNKYLTQNNNIYLLQDKIIIQDVKKVLNNNLKDLNASDIPNIFATYPPISSTNKDFILNIQIEPVFNRININNYLNKKLFSYIDNTINNILNFYEIQDPLLFKAIILDTLDKDSQERDNKSELILFNPIFQNGQIYNDKHFKQIIDYYYKLSKDKNIYKIPWNKYIFFGKINQFNIIDCNILDKNLAKFMGFDINYDKLSCKNLNVNDNKKLIKIFNVSEFKHNSPYWIKVDVNYTINNQINNLSFIYDINKKKVVKIEKHPVY